MLFKRFCLLVLLLSTTGLYAMTDGERDFYTIDRIELVEIKTDPLNQHVEKSIDIFKIDQEVQPDPIENAGRIISVARDLVALGEEIYSIVTHGKPNITTKYDPISVVPKEGGQPVDPMDMEMWQMPTKRTFSLNYKNKLGMKVVEFKFHVMWSYGGSYNGRGAYITGAQIIPAASVKWGFDFTATMKLGGIQNSGKKDNPIATASLILEHTVSNILNARSMSHIFIIDGKGRFKQM
jgi:hypothetical protein